MIYLKATDNPSDDLTLVAAPALPSYKVYLYIENGHIRLGPDVAWDEAAVHLLDAIAKESGRRRDEGAAVAFGLMGMAEAIRKNAPRLVERQYWKTDPSYYDCYCPGCGVLLKARDAGVDEGTAAEWCGSCRP